MRSPYTEDILARTSHLPEDKPRQRRTLEIVRKVCFHTYLPFTQGENLLFEDTPGTVTYFYVNYDNTLPKHSFVEI